MMIPLCSNMNLVRNTLHDLFTLYMNSRWVQLVSVPAIQEFCLLFVVIITQ